MHLPMDMAHSHIIFVLMITLMILKSYIYIWGVTGVVLEELLEECFEQGSKDNMTACLIRIGSCDLHSHNRTPNNPNKPSNPDLSLSNQSPSSLRYRSTNYNNPNLNNRDEQSINSSDLTRKHTRKSSTSHSNLNSQRQSQSHSSVSSSEQGSQQETEIRVSQKGWSGLSKLNKLLIPVLLLSLLLNAVLLWRTSQY